MSETPPNGKWLTPQTITSAGGIIISLFMLYLMFGLLRDSTNDTNHTLRDINATLQNLTKATQENTTATIGLRDFIKRQ